MLSHIQKRRIPTSPVSIVPRYTKLQRVQSQRNGVIVNSSELKVYDFTEQNKQFSVADFALQNLIAVGADRMLKPCQLSSINVDNVVSTAEKLSTHESAETPQA